MAACFAAKGHDVQSFLATQDVLAACAQADLVFMLVPTPAGIDGALTSKVLVNAARSVGQSFRARRDFPIVVVASTVMPGCTDGPIRSALESASGKRCGIDFGLAYCPSFASPESVLGDLLNPEFVLIGESDHHTGDRLYAFFQTVCENNPRAARMSLVNAELTKLALGGFLSMKNSYANMLAELCENLDGGDVDAVTHALGLDSRIGARNLKAGIGFGGPCLPRDNAALMSLASRLGVYAPLPQAADRINAHQLDRLGQIVQEHLATSGVLGVLGLAYLPSTEIVERSQGVILAAEFARRGSSVIVYDPCAMAAARDVLPESVRYADTASECARAADVLLICTADEAFKAVSADDLKRSTGKPRTVIDCWRILDRPAVSAVANYVAVGISGTSSQTAGLRRAA
jgi:UDPglucose 6-dehydrogenase